VLNPCQRYRSYAVSVRCRLDGLLLPSISLSCCFVVALNGDVATKLLVALLVRPHTINRVGAGREVMQHNDDNDAKHVRDPSQTPITRSLKALEELGLCSNTLMMEKSIPSLLLAD
jgi:hypothetical protein